MLEYHRRTDHGRDGYKLDERVVCNCRKLFAVHDLTIITNFIKAMNHLELTFPLPEDAEL